MFWSLEPTLAFSSPVDSSATLNFKLNITMENSFEFREIEGWQWHKTWMIPMITVTVLPENAESVENFVFPPNTTLTIMCVRPGSRNP